MKDIQFLQAQTTELKPVILGKTSVEGMLLYQKIVTLILSSSKDAYRQQAGCKLTALLQGANIPNDSILQSMGLLACSTVRGQLAIQDAQKIETLTAEAQNGRLFIILTLTSGQSYIGAVAGAGI